MNIILAPTFSRLVNISGKIIRGEGDSKTHCKTSSIVECVYTLYIYEREVKTLIFEP